MESNLMTAEGQARKQNTSTPSSKTGDLKLVRSQGTQQNYYPEGGEIRKYHLKQANRKSMGDTAGKRDTHWDPKT